jgi:hypothetical protein
MDIPPSLSVRQARAAKRFLPLLSALLAAILFTTSVAARAADEAAPAQSSTLPPAPALPPPANPALAVDIAPRTEQPILFGSWWFWAAVGAAAVATTIVVVISSRGQAPPSTDLGNREFQP